MRWRRGVWAPRPSHFTRQPSPAPRERAWRGTAMLAWQRVVPGFAADHHRDDAEERKAAHHRGHPVEAAAKGADEEPGDERPEAGDDPRCAVAEGNPGRADLGRGQLGG